jgi:hypothetical protein
MSTYSLSLQILSFSPIGVELPNQTEILFVEKLAALTEHLVISVAMMTTKFSLYPDLVRLEK